MRFLLLFLFCFPVLAQDGDKRLTVQTSMVSGPLFLQRPVMSDTVNIFGNRYDVKQMLKTGVSPTAFRRNAIEMKADTAGYFTIGHTPNDRAALYFFNFTVTAVSFAKAKLKVTSPQAFEIYVNDERATDKSAVQKVREWLSYEK